MCVIAIKPKNITIERETVEDMWAANPHGAGIAIPTIDGVIVQKGYMALEPLWEEIEQLQHAMIIVHFRWATHGGRGQDMTHPFIISTDEDELLAMDAITDMPVLIHNGIISGFGNAKLSDTAEFAKSVLAYVTDLKAMARICSMDNSKFVLIEKNTVRTVGDFLPHKGLTCSNLRFDTSYKKNTYGHGRKNHSDPCRNGSCSPHASTGDWRKESTSNHLPDRAVAAVVGNVYPKNNLGAGFEQRSFGVIVTPPAEAPSKAIITPEQEGTPEAKAAEATQAKSESFAQSVQPLNAIEAAQLGLAMAGFADAGESVPQEGVIVGSEAQGVIVQSPTSQNKASQVIVQNPLVPSLGLAAKPKMLAGSVQAYRENYDSVFTKEDDERMRIMEDRLDDLLGSELDYDSEVEEMFQQAMAEDRAGIDLEQEFKSASRLILSEQDRQYLNSYESSSEHRDAIVSGSPVRPSNILDFPLPPPQKMSK